MSSDHASSFVPAWWLARIPEVFSDLADHIAPESSVKSGEGDYRRLATAGAGFPMPSELRMFCRWHMPVHHAWPCNPEKIDGFVEKAARAIAAKFSSSHPRALLVGAFEPHARHGAFRKLASNLRGRALQLMPAASATVESLAPDDPVVHILLGSTGMFCGLQSPREANGYYPGGTRFIRQSGDAVLSRAGAKIAEALHHMTLFREVPPANAHWLELGACPGGMTSELLRHGYRVTAIDRAPLDHALDRADGLEFFRADVTKWSPPRDARYDVMLCDMNGPAEQAFAQVARLSRFLRARAPIVFTLKTAGAEDVASILELHNRVLAMASQAGLGHIHSSHLSYNRREFTLWFECGS